MVFIVVFLISVCAIYGLWSYRRYKTVGQYINKFPGLPGYPIVGNLPDFGRRPHEHLQIMRGFCQRFNHQMFSIYGGSHPYIIISNPDDAEAVLSGTQFLYKDDLYRFLRPWLGFGLLTSTGVQWHKHRKMITPSFHFNILQDFLSIMNEKSDKFVDLLKTVSADDAIFDIQRMVPRCTMDVICDTAMGVQVNSICGNENNIVMAINDMCRVVEDRTFSIIKRSDFLFQFTPLYQTQKRSLSVLRKEISKVIEKRRKIVNQNLRHEQNVDDEYKRPKMAFLDNLITAEIDGKPLTFEQIFQEVATFLFEGHDTTASAIIFTIYCLSRHPTVQERSFREQKRIFGDDISQQPTFQDINEMKYLEQVIRESFRMFPPIPLIARDTTDLVEINGKLLPPSTTILMLLIAMGFNEKYFENPLEFLPERFDPEFRERSNPFDYLPFSAGPRNCIGQRFAMMELKCTISNILRNFEILPPIDGMPMYVQNPSVPNDMPKNQYDPILATFVTLKSVNGVWIRLRERDRK